MSSKVIVLDKYVLFVCCSVCLYRKCFGCTNSLLTIYDRPQKSRDATMDSYIVQLDFSAAFDRVSHSNFLFKLISLIILLSIGVGGSVLPICREFLSSRRQRVVVDGATSEWIPIVSGVPQGSVFGSLRCILCTSEIS